MLFGAVSTVDVVERESKSKFVVLYRSVSRSVISQPTGLRALIHQMFERHYASLCRRFIRMSLIV